MEKMMEMVLKLGLQGEEALKFLAVQQAREDQREQQAAEREERAKAREEEKMKREADEKRMEMEMKTKQAEEQRRHELELRQLDLEIAQRQPQPEAANVRAKVPKLPAFVDGTDDLDSYLQRFERFALTNGWARGTWAVSLSALLTGRALDVYSRLPDDTAGDYDRLKEALQKRYDLTEDGYRRRFRDGKPEKGGSPEQFIARLQNYLGHWMELSGTEKSFDGLCNLVVKEQFTNACFRELSVYLRERAPTTLEDMAKVADQYLVAHNRSLSQGQSGGKFRAKTTDDKPKDQSSIQCYKCQGFGHKQADCTTKGGPSTSKKRCFNCNQLGHEARDCTLQKQNKKSPVKSADAVVNQPNQPEPSAGCLVQQTTEVVRATEDDVKSCIQDNELYLACGKSIPLMSNACLQPSSANMPVVQGRIGRDEVVVLRDTGCSGVVVKQDFVKKDQYTGNFVYMLLIDNTLRKVPTAKISIETPYLSGEVEVQCLPDAIYDLIIGNVPGARRPDDPVDPETACAVTTRTQPKRTFTPLKVRNGSEAKDIDRAEFTRFQKEDTTLDKFRGMTEPRRRKQYESWFEEKSGLLYRVFTHPQINKGKPFRQLLVPTKIRKLVLEVAHDSILGGHLGIKKTADKVLTSFFWPGLQGDVTWFCRSCDICQKTVQKGKVVRVPLQKMPLVDEPFKRVAVDLVGPIHPPSEEGHQYILTLVDHVTRYPEAVPLKRITTEVVAEALVDFYSRIGVPEEVLSDMGTQFVSECMKEVARLLSIRQLTTTPYHPMCNGLVEKFNGTLKTMLKRLCSEQPRQWHRYINALLFAYREVPQESTGFSPFELLYWRTIRGPMQILKELWTKDVEEPEVKNSYQYVFELREKMEDTLKIARQELEKSQKRYKHFYDKRARPRKMDIGDQVLVLLPTDSNKLLLQWKGPFQIREVVGRNDYRVDVNGKIRIYHANLLKKYVQRKSGPLETGVQTKSGSLDAGLAAVIDDDDTEDSENLLELGNCVAKESYKDVAFGEKLTPEQLKDVHKLVKGFSDIFTDVPGTTDLSEHRVQLTSDDPVKTKAYPMPFATRESLKKDIENMLKMGIIQESNSPYASPVVIVRKKDGSNRVCVDYRKLNKLTIFDSEPMDTAKYLFQKCSKDKFFTTIDLSKGYWQIPVAKEDVHKTAFVTPDGQFEFLMMPFGMVNSGATLKRVVKKLLKGLQCTDSYVDDIMVHTPLWDDHLAELRELFSRLRAAHLTARPTKCKIAAEDIDFVGHRISQGTIGLQQDNVSKIKDAPRPRTKTQVRSFLGLTGYYRAYIPNYAAIAVPLTDLTKNGQPTQVVWGDAQEKAFTTLKHLLTSQPILKLPDMEKTFVLRTDASDVGIGAVLLQETDEQLFPVIYASKKLLDRERRYSTIERECLAIVWAIQKFANYLYGKEFVIQTDHQPLIFLNEAKFVNNRIMRWTLFLQNYRFRMESIKGLDNVGADYLSRIG